MKVSDKKYAAAVTLDQREAIGYFWFQGDEGLKRLGAAQESGSILNATSVTIMQLPKTDLSWIGSLHELRRVHIDATSSSPVSFHKLKKLRSAVIYSKFLPSIQNFEKLRGLKFLELHSPSAEDLARISGSAKHLRVFGPPAIWPVIETPARIKSLTILFAGKPTQDVGNISYIKNLRTLCFFRGKGTFMNCDPLAGLRKLRTLEFEGVKNFENSEWVFKLRRLKSIYATKSSYHAVFTEEQIERLHLARIMKSNW